MNTILLNTSEINSQSLTTLSDYRYDHIVKVLRSSVGDILKVGIIDGNLYRASIQEIGTTHVTLKLSTPSAPPPPLPAILVCALPRPKMFRRILHTAIVSGIKEIHFIKSWRVDKSYWHSPFILPESIATITHEALSQACDTMMPVVHFHKTFKPFVEDVFPTLAFSAEPLLFHPQEDSAQRWVIPHTIKKPFLLIIGPEGGFIEYEVASFSDAGATPISLGSRIFQTEQVIPLILGHLMLSLASR